MAKTKRFTKSNLSACLYRVSKSGPNRLHIEIPSKDRPEFRSGSTVVVMPFDEHIQKSLKKIFGKEVEFSLTNEVR